MSTSHSPCEARVHALRLGTAPPRSRHLYLVTQRLVGRVRYAETGRSLHLIDIENLMGGPFAGGAALKEASEAYRVAARVGGCDHVVVGANPSLAVEAGLEWPGARLLVRGGPDGADLALEESVEEVIWHAQRYDRVVIGSGDGRFSEVARSFKAAGIPVGVVARERSLALVLAQAATFVTLLPACAAKDGAA